MKLFTQIILCLFALAYFVLAIIYAFCKCLPCYQNIHTFIFCLVVFIFFAILLVVLEIIVFTSKNKMKLKEEKLEQLSIQFKSMFSNIDGNPIDYSRLEKSLSEKDISYETKKIFEMYEKSKTEIFKAYANAVTQI